MSFILIKTCLHCGKEFNGRLNAKYCKDCLTGKTVCPICGKEMPVLQTACSRSCAGILKNKVYGNHGGTPEAREKAKQTMLAKYGVENTATLPEFKQKAKEAQEAKHGGAGFSSATVCAKIRGTLQERYGVTNSYQTETARQRRRQACEEHKEEIKQKFEQTCLEKFGVKTPLSRPNQKELTKKTCQEKYGVDWPSNVPETKEKIREVQVSKYGGMGLASDIIKAKAIKTNRERYGVDCVLESPAVREKIVKTMEEKWGGCLIASPVLRERIETTNLTKYGTIYAAVSPEVNPALISKTNLKWQSYLPGSTLEFSLGGKSFDLFYNGLLIEINPNYTHNSTVSSKFNNSPLPKDYHLQKTLLAQKYGYRCFHIWDWDDQVKIKYLLTRKKPRVYARNTVVQLIDKKQANAFLDLYHLQGGCRSQDVCYGLYYENELIAVMTFGKPRYNKNYEWELVRFAADRDIIGGSAKLFSAFIREYNPSSIISYCDRSKFLGEGYIKLGFTFSTFTVPAKHWVNMKTVRHITDNLLRQRGADELIGTDFGKGTDNEEIMRNAGYVEVYDCGQLVFTWTKKD